MVLAPPPLPAGVSADVRETVYPVSGHTVQAIEASLAANGPLWEGKRVWGLAQWRVRWDWRAWDRGETCDLADLLVSLSVEITLPEWQDGAAASPGLRMQWERFRDALHAHECGHRNRAFLAAEAVHQALAGIHAADCARLTQEVTARAHAVLDHHQALDREYERTSQRGRTQGAVWPPGSWP